MQAYSLSAALALAATLTTVSAQVEMPPLCATLGINATFWRKVTWLPDTATDCWSISKPMAIAAAGCALVQVLIAVTGTVAISNLKANLLVVCCCTFVTNSLLM